MAVAVVCAACGAKVRSDRARCPRCREPLVARQEDAAATSNRWVTAGLVTGCIVLAGLTVTLINSSRTRRASSTNIAASTSRSQAAAAEGPATTPVNSVQESATANLIAGERAYDSGNLQAALEAFQIAVAASPDDPRARNNLGQVLVKLGRADEALPHLDRAAQLASDNWSYQFNRARAYAEAKQWSTAVAGYQRASQLFPSDYATQFNLAKALQASGDVNGAVTAYEKAIALAPGQPDFQLSYGRALEAAARPRDAVAAYRRYLELEPASTEAERVKAHVAQLESSSPTSPNNAGPVVASGS